MGREGESSLGGLGDPREQSSKRMWADRAQVDPHHPPSADHRVRGQDPLERQLREAHPLQSRAPRWCHLCCASCFLPSTPFCSSDNTPALSPSTQSGRGTYSREPPCEGRPANRRSQEDGGGEGWARSTSTGLWRPPHPILVRLGSDASGGALLPVTSAGLGGWTPLSQVCPSLSGPCQRNNQRARHGDPGGAQGPGVLVTRCGAGGTLSFLGAWWGGGRFPAGSHPWSLFSVQLLSGQGLGLERWSLTPRGGAWSFFGTGL